MTQENTDAGPVLEHFPSNVSVGERKNFHLNRKNVALKRKKAAV